MDKICSLLEPFDIFALTPLMTFARDRKVYSRFSRLLTFLTVCAFISMVSYLGKSLFQRKNPSFFQYKLPNPGVNSKLMFDSNTFPIKLSKKFGFLEYGRDFYFSSRAFTLIPSGDSFPFDPVECSDNDVFMCFNQTGRIGESYITTGKGDSFEIGINTCDATSDPGCLPNDQLQENFSNDGLMFQYNNYVVDPYDYENPIKNMTEFVSEPLILDMNKVVYITLEVVEVITDNGWMFENLVTETRVGVGSIVTRLDDLVPEWNFRGGISVSFSGDKNIYRRTYPKIQDLLAEITGIMAFLIPILAALASPFAEFKMREHIVNELYEVRLNRDQDRGGKNPKNSMVSNSKNQRKSVYKVNEEEPSSNRPLFNVDNSSATPFSDRFENSRNVVNQKNSDLQGELQKSQEKQQVNENNVVSMMNNSHISEEPKAKTPQRDMNFKIQKSIDNDDQNDKTAEQISKRQKSPKTRQLNKNESRIEKREGSFTRSLDQGNNVDRGGEEASSESIGESKTARNVNSFILENDSSEPPKTNLVKNVEAERLDQRVEIVVEENKSILENEESSKSAQRHSDKINVGFTKFLWSFIKRQPEIELIDRAEREITDSMDIAAIARKCSDFEKLKMILLTSEERAIFDNLPVSVLSLNSEKDSSKKLVVNYYKWKKSMTGKRQKVNEAYVSLKKSAKKSELQRKLLGLYESQYLEDYHLS